MRPREGSRKAQVYDVFTTQGAANAEQVGISLGLAPGTLRSWFGTWAKAGSAPQRNAPLEPEPMNGSPFRKQQKVYDIGAPKRFGVIIACGPEVAEVKWDNGMRQYVTNEYLRVVSS